MTSKVIGAAQEVHKILGPGFMGEGLRDPETLREKWKDIATISGPDGLRAIRGFHDEALAGEWKGCRSSRLNEQWRVIYSVEAGVMTVLVIRVTPHDYRRR